MVTEEELKKAERNYRDHLINVVAKCSHDQNIVFAMMGNSRSKDEHVYVFKCTKCNGHMWEIKNNIIYKQTITPNEKYLCKWDKILPQEEPRLIPHIDKNVFDYARELYIDVSKETWTDLR